jgi:hypothetical protein
VFFPIFRPGLRAQFPAGAVTKADIAVLSKLPMGVKDVVTHQKQDGATLNFVRLIVALPLLGNGPRALDHVDLRIVYG